MSFRAKHVACKQKFAYRHDAAVEHCRFGGRRNPTKYHKTLEVKLSVPPRLLPVTPVRFFWFYFWASYYLTHLLYWCIIRLLLAPVYSTVYECLLHHTPCTLGLTIRSGQLDINIVSFDKTRARIYGIYLNCVPHLLRTNSCFPVPAQFPLARL